MVKAAAETKASQRVAMMTGVGNICGRMLRAGIPMRLKPRPPVKRLSPVALMALMVGLIFEKKVRATAPLPLAISM